MIPSVMEHTWDNVQELNEVNMHHEEFVLSCLGLFLKAQRTKCSSAPGDLPNACRQAWMSSSQLAPLLRCPRGIAGLAWLLWAWPGLWNL